MAEPDAKSSTTTGGTQQKKWNRRNKCHRYKPTVQPTKSQGGKEEVDGNYFDCIRHGQSDRFVKTVGRIANFAGQDDKIGGITRTEVMTHTNVVITVPVRSRGTVV